MKIIRDDLEFFRKWIDDATQNASREQTEDDTPEGADARARRIAGQLATSYLAALAFMRQHAGRGEYK